MGVVLEKLKEVLYSVLPITILVVILHFTLTPIETGMLLRFLFGAVLIVVGLTIFLLGVDISIAPIGNVMGATITKTNKLWVVAVAGVILGFFISIAEPDLHILAGQVDLVTGGLISKISIVGAVSLGIAVMLAVGLIRIVYNFPLYKLLFILYSLIFIIAIVVSPEFLAISFDASGATTGALTVPFILALALGVSKLKKDSKSSEEDSFGLVAIASTGAIIAVMLMSLLFRIEKITGTLEDREIVISAPLKSVAELFSPFIQKLPLLALESMVALLPILIIFLIFQKLSFKLSARSVRKIFFGMMFTFLGLVLFLLGVNAGFMDVGSVVGKSIASLDNKAYLVAVGFILGFVTILAEPAVYVLTHQIEAVTSGYVKRKIVMMSLSVGVGLAVALSMIRIIVPGLQLWQYLLPGYILSCGMMFYVPELFVGMAFDSGGVASGPMTATFILAYAQGAAEAVEGANVLVDGFGMIAMVAMTPIIALQVLGLFYQLKSKKGEIEEHG